MGLRRLGATMLIAVIAPTLSMCAGQGPDSRYAIDIRRFESDEQTLELRNTTTAPIEILHGKGGRGTTLAPNATMAIRFKVQSLESHLRVADMPYFFRMAGPVTNRFEETDNMTFVEETPGLPVLYFRDGEGIGEVSFDVNSCAEMPAGTTWETMQWGPGSFEIQIPPRFDGDVQPLCPVP